MEDMFLKRMKVAKENYYKRIVLAKFLNETEIKKDESKKDEKK